MGSIIEKIIKAIKNKNVLSIVYDNGKDRFYQRIHPYYLFKYNDKVQLIAFNECRSTVVFYKVDKFTEAEVMSLCFSETIDSFKSYIENNKYYKAEKADMFNCSSDENDIESLTENASSYTREQRITDYYINSLKKEALMDVDIKYGDSGEFFIIDKDLIKKIFDSKQHSVLLYTKFKYMFQNWKHRMINEPDLVIYLGYPIFKYRGKMFPLLYYPVSYDETKNSIKFYESDAEVNGKFINDDMDMMAEDTKIIKEKILKNDVNDAKGMGLNEYFEDMFNQAELMNYGVLFLQVNSSSIKGLITDLKNIRNNKNEDNSIPLNSFFEGKDLSSEHELYNHIYNVVNTNVSQSCVIANTNRNLLLVQGPPGTGKTQTIVNLIANEVINGGKVLIASMNNKAVDNVMEKMKLNGIYPGILRLGKQEIREAAAKEIDEVLKKDYTADIKEIDECKRKSFELQKKINECSKKIKLKDELEDKLKDLNEAYKLQEDELKSREIDCEDIKKYINGEYSSNELLKSIDILNSASIMCENIINKNKSLIIRILEPFNFDYEKYIVKKLKKMLKETVIMPEYLKNIQHFAEMNIYINNMVIYLQYYVMHVKTVEILDKLNKLNKEELKNEINTATEDKMKNDKCLLKLIYDMSMNNITEKEKSSLILKIENEEEKIFKSDSKEYSTILNAFPVIACTNLSVPGCIPSNVKFDIAVIDESSQCNIPSSIPVMARCKRLVVVGDDKQLGPVISTDKNDDLTELKKAELEEEKNKYSFSCKSTFDMIGSIINKKYKYLLEEHYRCQPEIINFCNSTFYENKLSIMTKKTDEKISGMKMVDVKGFAAYGSGGSKSAYNNTEADTIIEYINSNYDELKRKSIGIITPFKRQKELIKRKLDAVSKNVDYERSQFLKDVEVGTVHTFQGGERQVILFSAVLGNGIKQGAVNWLNGERNLVNVSVSRAIDMFIFFGDVSYIKNTNGILNELVKYIESIHGKAEKVKLKSIFNVLIDGKKKKSMNNKRIRNLLNGREAVLYNVLYEIMRKKYKNYYLGIKIRLGDVINISKELVSQDEFMYGLCSHFDFVIFDMDCNLKPVFAIEYDGKYHRRSGKAIINDGMKNNICKVHDFTLERISSESYVTNDFLENMLAKNLKLFR